MKITGIIRLDTAQLGFLESPGGVSGQADDSARIERAASATTLSEVIVATDDARIMAAVEKFGDGQ